MNNIKQHIKQLSIVITTFLLLASPVLSFGQKYSEYDVKAAYLYNFIKFIDWPPAYIETKKHIVIGVYKNQQFGDILEHLLENKKIKGKMWEIRFLYSIKDVASCDVLFISSENASETINIIKATKNKPILTIGNNIKNFCQYGGIINFTPKGSVKRFEINNEAAKKHKLKISSKLLALAKIVGKK